MKDKQKVAKENKKTKQLQEFEKKLRKILEIPETEPLDTVGITVKIDKEFGWVLAEMTERLVTSKQLRQIGYELHRVYFNNTKLIVYEYLKE